MCKRLSTTVDLGPGINKYPPLRIEALTPRRALEESTLNRINPSTVQPYRAGPRAAELGPRNTLKQDAPGASLRGLLGVPSRTLLALR